MKQFFIKYVPVLACLMLLSCNDPMPKVTVYNAPDNLSKVQGLTESPFFKVMVEDKQAFVYYGKDDVADVAYNNKGISFLSFEMSHGPVFLDIKTEEIIDSFQVQQSPGGVEQLGQKQIKITIDEPIKLLVTAFFAKSGQQDFIISAEMPDWKKPKEDAKGVLYLKPGIYQFGEGWNPFINGIHTLYLEGGAVVEATLNVTNIKDVNILGRGIFAQAFATNVVRKEETQKAWFASGMGISLTNVKNVKVEGITIMNSPACQLAINNAEEVLIKNLKLCGFGGTNNDGLHLFSRNVIAEDLFICSSTDRIVLNGEYDTQKKLLLGEPIEKRLISTIAENIQIRDGVLYGVNGGADIMLSRNANADLRTILVEGITSLADTENGFVAALHSGSGNIFDVVIAESTLSHSHLVDMQVLNASEYGKGGGKIRSVYLDDVTIPFSKVTIGNNMTARSAVSNITDVIFTNITASNGMVHDFKEMNITTNAFVTNIKVQVVERDE